MIIASSSGSRAGRPVSGSVSFTIASQVLYEVSGARGRATRGIDAGTPGSCFDQVSSLPTKRSFASLCSSTYLIVSALSVGKIATVVNPPIQIASSARKKWAQFLVSIATLSPRWSPCACSHAATRLAWSRPCFQV